MQEAITYMKELSAECGDISLEKKLETYRKHPTKFRAKRIAAMLHKKKHAAVVDLLTRRLREATAEYPRRFLGDELERKYEKMLKMARKRQQELEEQGYKSDILREEPFTIARDSLGYKVYLMIWKEKRGDVVVEVEEYACK